MQGWREEMEDAHTAVLDLLNSDEPQRQTAAEKRLSFFGVYDGHGGGQVAQFTGKFMHQILTREAAFGAKDYEQALKDAFLATDRAILQGTGARNRLRWTGCTASVALITNTKIYVVCLLAIRAMGRHMDADNYAGQRR
jgi:protein phosphatase 2C family protein 2/3